MTICRGWVKANKKEIEAKLLETGVLLFRGFPLSTPQDFKDFIDAFEYEHGTYLGGGGPRNVVLGMHDEEERKRRRKRNNQTVDC